MLYTLEKEMNLALIVEFFASLPKLVNLISELNSEIKQLRLTKQSEEIMAYKQEVSAVLSQITKAKTDEERKKLSLDLALKLNR